MSMGNLCGRMIVHVSLQFYMHNNGPTLTSFKWYTGFFFLLFFYHPMQGIPIHRRSVFFSFALCRPRLCRSFSKEHWISQVCRVLLPLVQQKVCMQIQYLHKLSGGTTDDGWVALWWCLNKKVLSFACLLQVAVHQTAINVAPMFGIAFSA